ncbi:MAG: hypothetical protein UX23_C0016G0003 [Parcubacteria group bacterium GW2011_GWB1_45_9]|nr:MAG: hypothetical protein UX23_C0016G0003 [Parcubacteria group bacterium GW2011_GWB1_45_9]
MFRKFSRILKLVILAIFIVFAWTTANVFKLLKSDMNVEQIKADNLLNIVSADVPQSSDDPGCGSEDGGGTAGSSGGCCCGAC